MPAPGKRHHFDVLPVLNQLVDQRERVCEVYVVVACPMRDAQLALQTRGLIDRRRLAIAVFILWQQPQVSLRIGEIVEVPGVNRSARKTTLESSRGLEHR